jgi:hypothetical protein
VYCCVLVALPQGVVRAALTSAKPVQDEGLQLLRQLLPQVMASAEQVRAVQFNVKILITKVLRPCATSAVLPCGDATTTSKQFVSACRQRPLWAGAASYLQQLLVVLLHEQLCSPAARSNDCLCL